MKNNCFLLPFVILITIGCNSIPKDFTQVNGSTPTQSNNSCSNIIKDIQNKWSKHNQFNCYFYNKKLIEKIILNSNDCFKGLEKKEIISLFGKPNRNDDNILSYNVAKKCDEISDLYGDYSLMFRFSFNDSNQLVVSNIKLNNVVKID